MNEGDWAALGTALRILSPALGGWAIYLLRKILAQLQTLNGRVTKIESWEGAHERLDETRFEALEREIASIATRFPGRR